ncbi:cysteine hydrolase family protein [Xiamenia xianingshaonis]|uniref:Cysteine hydrolase n=1 Tax=Xiamenia xianingshaonis TaxID=2682776 RepID=A0A9E6SV78_9ACTN|nr:isochorismatase family cysteine hydrolase [Xiamenia xianingshaonis]NGM16618.1 isochorismatase family protein [Eggerthellaceae bacterium zg-893]NHM14553.1 isochorismatase family protein [Xiamenia xianingshaonis]NHM16130.1 isochorismatase family protein [Xiamenia xianingshaonis]QTU84997.1 cysteine hydrolase [Xiamenia xianingshaonis]
MPYVPVAQDTPWQQATDIDVARTAVLVVDILGGEEGVVPGLEAMAQNAARIVAAAHEAGVPVVCSCDAHISGLDREIELWGEHGIAGTEAAKPLASLGVREGDFIVPKRRYDGFFQTDLDLTLRELGVDTLVVCGCDTNICVQHTLAGAYFRTYKTVVAADACGTFLIGTQEAGLDYFTRCYDSRVVDTDTVLAYLQRSGR